MDSYTIHSYVPEHVFFDGKQDAFSPILPEDFAVVAAGNGRILACRGQLFHVGDDWRSACKMTKKELDYAGKYAHVSKKMLLKGACGAVLLFAGFRYVGVDLVLVPHARAASVRSLLASLSHSEVMLSPAAEAENASSADDMEALFQTLSRCFFYLDRLLTMADEYRPLTQCLLAANFAGCRIAQPDLPSFPVPIAIIDRQRLNVFLLSAFLALRMTDDAVTAEGGEEPGSGRERTVYMTVSRVPRSSRSLPKPRNQILDLFPVLSLPDFENFFQISELNGTFSVKVLLPVPKTNLVIHAVGASSCTELWIQIA